MPIPSILPGIVSSQYVYPVVTGGTLSSDSTYYYRAFTSSGTLTVSGGSVTMDVWVCGGGGPTTTAVSLGTTEGWDDNFGPYTDNTYVYPGGGGAGGVATATNQAITGSSTVTVGNAASFSTYGALTGYGGASGGCAVNAGNANSSSNGGAGGGGGGGITTYRFFAWYGFGFNIYLGEYGTPGTGKYNGSTSGGTVMAGGGGGGSTSNATNGGSTGYGSGTTIGSYGLVAVGGAGSMLSNQTVLASGQNAYSSTQAGTAGVVVFRYLRSAVGG